MQIEQNFSNETVGVSDSSVTESRKSTFAQNLLGVGLLSLSLAVQAVPNPSAVYSPHLSVINPSSPGILYNNEFFDKPVTELNADNDRMIEDYNSFVQSFLANAKDMDNETATLINDNYVDLLAT